MQQERDTTLDSVRIDQWLAEDLGPGDITTRATLGADRAVQASWIAKADGIVAGLAIGSVAARGRRAGGHCEYLLAGCTEITRPDVNGFIRRRILFCCEKLRPEQKRRPRGPAFSVKSITVTGWSRSSSFRCTRASPRGPAPNNRSTHGPRHHCPS